MNTLYADQTPKVFPVSGPFKVYFMSRQAAFNPRGGRNVSMLPVPVNASYGQGYASIEQLIKECAAENRRKFTVDELRKQVALDTSAGFGVEFPELGVVAYAGVSPYDKPIAMYRLEDGRERYIPHPHIEDYIKLI